MNNRSKKGAALALAGWMALTLPLQALAEEIPSPLKEEVIYANLGTDGSLESLYVVNSYDLDQESQIVDYGGYTSVKNLTTTDPISLEDGTVRFTAPKGKFYYQGTLPDREIPWTVSLSYRLDGQPIEGKDLAGASGHLEMTLDILQNPNADPIYREDFSLQTTIVLDSERCRNIQAPEATVANAGGNKQLSYILLAGDEGHFSITADVTNFEMDGIQINAIPLTLNIDDPDTSEIKDRIYDLQDGARQLDDGAQTMRDGVGQLRDGTDDLEEGAYDLFDGSRELYRGAKELSDGSPKLAQGASDLRDGFQQLNESSTQLKAGIAALQEQTLAALEGAGMKVPLPTPPENPLDTAYRIQVGGILDKALDEAISALKEQLAGLGTTPVPPTDLLPAADPASPEGSQPASPDGSQDVTTPSDGENPPSLPEEGTSSGSQDGDTTVPPDGENPPAQTGDGTSTGSTGGESTPPSQSGSADEPKNEAETVPAQTASGASSGESGTAPSSKALAATAYEGDPAAALKTQIQTLEQLKQMNQLTLGQLKYLQGTESLSAGFSQLYAGLDQLLGGIDQLKDGSSSLKSGAGDLYDGVTDLTSGVNDLYDGTVELEDGTAELKDQSADMENEVDEKIDEILDDYRGGSHPAVSFVSDQNTQVESVQFVIKTGEISLPDKETPPPAQEEHLSLWQRILRLFQ